MPSERGPDRAAKRAVAPLEQRLRWDLWLSRGAGALLLMLFAALVVGPLLVLMAQTVSAVLAGHASWLRLTLPSGRTGVLLGRSLGLAAAVALGGTTIGLLAAMALWRCRTGLLRHARWLILVTATLPPYLHATVWKNAAAAANSLLVEHGLATFPLRGWGVSWWVQMMALLPLGIGLGLIGLELVEARQLEAARLVRPDLTVLRKVVLPLAAPALWAGAGMLFLLALMDYSAPSLCGVDTYPFEIFAEYSATSEPVRAFLLAVPLLLAAGIVLVALQSLIRGLASDSGRSASADGASLVWPEWLSSAQLAALAVLGAQVLVPVLVMVSSTQSWAGLGASTSAASHEFYFTLGVSALTALLCLPLGLIGALGMTSRRPSAWLWCLLVSLPVAVPAPLVGIGLVALHTRLPGAPLYGTVWLPVLAALARFAPFATIAILAQMRRLDPALTDAVRVHQPSAWRGWLQVRLPLLAPGLLAAAIVTFALTAGELGATLIVAPPGYATITMRIYNYLHYGSQSDVAGLCLMMTGLTLAAGLLAAVVFARWRKLMPRSSESERCS